MSIQSQINRIKQQVNNVYNVLESKNLIPFGTEKKLENLEQIVYDAPIGDTTVADTSVVEFIERSNTDITNTSLTSLGQYSAYQSNFVNLVFNRVESTGDYCFRDSTSLVKAYFPKLKTVGSYMFYGCTNLTDVKFDSLEIAGQYMFYNSGITSIDEEKFPVLKTLGPYSFASTSSNITSIDHTRVTTIGEYALSENRKIKSWNLPNVIRVDRYGMNNMYDDSTEYNDILTSYPLPLLESIGAWGMANMSNTTSIYYPNLLTIDSNAFQKNSNLTNVNLPLLSTMGRYAFSECYKLKSITLPNVVTSGGYIFSNCSELNTVELPSLTTINEGYIFSNAPKLRNVKLNNFTSTQNVSDAFRNSSFTNFESDNFEYAYTSTFRDCQNLLEFYKPRLAYIGQQCFYGCTSLQKIWIPKESIIQSTSSKSYYPFYNCRHLEIFTDATEKPSNWGDSFNYANSNTETLTVHYNATKEDYDNHKILDANPYSNTYTNRLRILDGVVSNFYNTSCVRVRNWDFNRTGNIELVIKFTMPTEQPTSSQWLYSNYYWSKLGIGNISNNMTALTRYRYTDNSHVKICDLELGETYYLKVYINGGKERFYLSTDGEVYNYIVEDKESTDFTNNGTFETYMLFGNESTSSSYYWRGSIDFNKCYIRYGDEVLWVGVKGAPVSTGTEYGYEAPQPEVLNTDGLVAHWDFENNYIDSVSNISIRDNQQGNLMADESYRGSYSMIPRNNGYEGLDYSTDISSLNLSLDNDFSVSFKVHSDYFGNDNYSDSYYYGLTFKLFSTHPSTSYYTEFANWSIVNGGYSSITFSGNITADTTSQSVKDLLHSGWNKFELVYRNSDNRISLYINDGCIGSLCSNNIIENKNITNMYLFAQGSNYKQYIDDICFYNIQTKQYTDKLELNTDGLVGYWDFCENSTTGKTAYQDSISNVTLGSYRLSINNWGNDNVGCGVTYSSQQSSNISSFGLNSSSDFTLEFDSDVIGDSWYGTVRPTDGELLQSFITLRNSSDSDIFGVGTNKWGINGGRIYPLVGDFTIPTNVKDKWNTFTLTYTASSHTLKLYINGEKIQETVYSSDFSIHYINLNLGSYNSSYGVIDNLKIYNKVTIQDN